MISKNDYNFGSGDRESGGVGEGWRSCGEVADSVGFGKTVAITQNPTTAPTAPRRAKATDG